MAKMENDNPVLHAQKITCSWLGKWFAGECGKAESIEQLIELLENLQAEAGVKIKDLQKQVGK